MGNSLHLLRKMFRVYVGVRGAGKSAYAAKIAKKYQKKGITVYSNFYLDGCKYYDIEDLGYYNISDGVLILDEAGIEVSNREFKDRKNVSTSKEARKFWKLSRHYGIEDVYVFSQAFDFDATLRRLADSMYIIRNSIIPHVSFLRSCRPFWDTDDDGQPCIKWKLGVLPVPFFRYPYYKYYDSFAVSELPYKEFEVIHSVKDVKSPIREKIVEIIDKYIECYPMYVKCSPLALFSF